jgi:hypothetical protein
MTYTVNKLARLALAAYFEKQTTVDEWERRVSYGDPTKGGFFAELFKSGSDWALAIRGTDDRWDLIPDAQIALNFIKNYVPNQLPQAQLALDDAKTQAKKQRLALTGHSLGGGLAVLLAMSAELPVVSFNAPGVALSYVKEHAALPGGLLVAPFYAARALQAAYEDRPKILNIRATFDAVSVGTGPQLGHVNTIHVPGCTYAFDSFARSFAELPYAMVANRSSGSVQGEELMIEATKYVLCQHSMELMERRLREMPEYNRELAW